MEVLVGEEINMSKAFVIYLGDLEKKITICLVFVQVFFS